MTRGPNQQEKYQTALKKKTAKIPKKKQIQAKIKYHLIPNSTLSTWKSSSTRKAPPPEV